MSFLSRLLGAWQTRLAKPAGRLAMADVLPLDARRKLLLVRADDRHVLLLIGGAQDIVVGWLPPP